MNFHASVFEMTLQCQRDKEFRTASRHFSCETRLSNKITKSVEKKTTMAKSSSENAHQILPPPPGRGIICDAGWLGTRRHLVHGLIEVDVTDIREYIKERKQQGVSLSFTAFIIWCLAKCMEQQPLANTYRNWRGRYVTFENVDCVAMIEDEEDHVALPHIVRRANRKTFPEISDEIRSIQSSPKMSSQHKTSRNRVAEYAPACLRRLFFRLALVNPQTIQSLMGTTIVTSVGMFGKGSGWGIGFLPIHTIGITVGGMSTKPAFDSTGNVVPREFLCVTLTFDHDIVDGAPAARFTNTFKELAERGYSYEECKRKQNASSEASN